MKMILFLVALTFPVLGKCQAQVWTDWQNLYSSNGMTIQISFKISYCKKSSSSGNYIVGYSYYRTNNIAAREKSYLRGKFNFIDCDGNTVTETFTVDLSKQGIDQNQGMWFLGKRVERIFDIVFEDLGAVEKKRTSEENLVQLKNKITLGDRYLEQGEYDNSIKSYEEALTLNPDFSNKSNLDLKISSAKTAKEQLEKMKQIETEKEARDMELEKEKLEQKSKDDTSNTAEKSADQVMEENFQNYKNVNNEAQRQQEDFAKEQAATQVATMSALGFLIFQDVGPEYDQTSNKYKTGSWRFNVTTGFSFSSMPIYESFEYNQVNSNGPTTKSNSTNESNVQTINFDVGLHYWPYYSKALGLGFFAIGSGGYLPLSGGGTMSYDWGIGAKVFMGSFPIKGVGSFQVGDRGFSSLSTYSFDAISSTSYGEGATSFSRASIGLRFSFETNSSIGNLEILYLLESYEYMKEIKSKGFGITFYAHNRLKFNSEILLDGARVGVIKYALDNDTKNIGLHYRIGVSRSLDWFGQGR